MSKSEMLTYEDELLISDDLYERRRVRELLKAEDREATAEEARIIERGNEAAGRLVLAYAPFIRSRAVFTRYRSGLVSNVDLEDLVQEGMRAALVCTNAFDARGRDIPGYTPDVKRGRRFSGYSSMHITKEIRRALHAGTSAMTAGLDTVVDTWTFLGVMDQMRAELGREPTLDEVEERSGISAKRVAFHLPYRGTTGDVNDMIGVSDQGPTVESMVAGLLDRESYNLRLGELLEHILGLEYMNILQHLIGVHTGTPMAHADVARMTGVRSGREVARIEARIYDILRHPQTMVRAHNFLAVRAEQDAA